MRLTGLQSAALQQALLDAYPEHSHLKLMLSRQLDRNLSRISLAESLDGVAQQLIARANAEGWVYELILAARRDNPGNEALRDFASALPSASGTSGGDNFDVLFFRNRPLVDRDRLRDALRHLDALDGKRILIVDGGAETGKSYSVELIQHLKGIRQYSVVDIDLLRYAKPNVEVTAWDIAESIALQMGVVPPDKVEHEQLSRWVVTCANWLKGKLRNVQETWWIVIDHFERLSLPDSTIDLVQELARLADGPVPNMRLVLVGYRHGLPANVEPSVEREAIEELTEVHLVEFFIRFITQKFSKRLEEEVVAEIAASSTYRVLVATEAQHEHRLSAIAAYVTSECQEIEARARQ
jgi:Effector-associated domain 1